mgnify:FL=1|jgi:hypothetical protein
MMKKEFKTTKADERAALELIRGILAELDPAGYVNTAFEGCCDVAESNIDNDFANSYKKSLMCVKEKFKESLVKRRCLQAQLNASNKSRDNRKEMLDVMFKRNEHLESENKKLCIENESLQSQIHTANKIIDTYKTASVIADEIIDKLKKSNACLLGLLVDRLK